MTTVAEHGPRLGIAPTCNAIGLPRATYYRHRHPSSKPRKRGAQPRALSAEARQEVLDVLHEPRFVDQAPAEVYATLLDEDRYLCSERTMYRILETAGEVRERRDQLRHPSYAAPELLATRPNQVWSWDITKLRTFEKWTYFYLYVILDVFSRYAVGWMVAERETAALAKRLIDETCERQGIVPGQLTLHADRGAPMTAKTTAQLLADIGVTESHSRPQVSDDNPFSESQFKTLKYQPDYPDRFAGLQHARSFNGEFFGWYNTEHRHSGIGYLTPHQVHYGLAEAATAKRAAVLAAAHARHPERFVRGMPTPPAMPTAVWINKPTSSSSNPSCPAASAPVALAGVDQRSSAGGVKGEAAQRAPQATLDAAEHGRNLEQRGLTPEEVLQ